MLGIMAAMPEEITGLHDLMCESAQFEIGGRKYYTGTLWGQSVVIVFSRWGKVAAAATAATLINRFNVQKIIFTGVAGAVDSRLRVGDVVIGSKFYQHDLDARPFFAKHEIPLLGATAIAADQDLSDVLAEAATQFLQVDKKSSLFRGDIASGDRFFASRAEMDLLRQSLPDVLCVEMEGAAVAQVCFEHEVPFAVVRTISDDGHEGAPSDFTQFIEQVACRYSIGIVGNALKI